MTSQCWITNLFWLRTSPQNPMQRYAVRNIDMNKIELNKTTTWFAVFSWINLEIRKHVHRTARPVFDANFSKYYRFTQAIEIIAVYKLANDDEPFGMSLQLNPKFSYRLLQTLAHSHSYTQIKWNTRTKECDALIRGILI